MSFPALPRRPTGRGAVPAATPPTAVPTGAVSPDLVPTHADPRAAGRFRYGRGKDTWEWSPEVFTVLGLDPGTTPPGADALVRSQHPGDRGRTLDAFSRACAGRPFALEVRADGGRRAVVLIGGPELDGEGRVRAVAGICADITAGRPPETDGTLVQALELEVEQLRAAMASRGVIEQAKGIVMLLSSCRDQTAFGVLTHISSHTHRKVRDVARAITESASGGTPLPEEIGAILRDACPPTPHLR